MSRRRANRLMILFAATTLAPVVLIALGAVWGGWWVLLALGYMTVLALALDEAVSILPRPAAPGVEFPAALWLSAALGAAHFLLLGLGIHALAGGTGLGLVSRLLLFVALGLFLGQVSNANAHELIHRPLRWAEELGRWIYISILFGHHASAHRLVHHRHVGTEEDPNSARLGEGFYAFARRAWTGSFRAGLAAEKIERSRARRGPHPYLLNLAGAVLFVALAYALGGVAGILAYLLLACHATAQLLMSDYVQHYGLARQPLPNGRTEPVGLAHSWNAPHWFTGTMMLNAPRHSDHHLHPARPFVSLDIADGAPVLPHSLPVMGVVALFPGRWREMMDPLVVDLAVPPAFTRP